MNYNSKRWHQKRQVILRRDGYIDQVMYMMYGVTREANLIHHLLPVSQYPEYQWCSWNMIAINRATHEKLHERKSDVLTPMGLAVAEMFLPEDKKNLP